MAPLRFFINQRVERISGSIGRIYEEAWRTAMELKQHWERVFLTKGATEVSWFQMEPTLSLRLLDHAGLNTAS